MPKPKPFPCDIEAWLKQNPRAEWPCHAASSLHPHHPRWYSCRWNGSVESALEFAQPVFPDAWAERDGMGTWLYLRQAREGEGTKEQP